MPAWLERIHYCLRSSSPQGRESASLSAGTKIQKEYSMSLEIMTVLCDVCKERPIKKVQKIKGEYKAVCSECELKENKTK